MKILRQTTAQSIIIAGAVLMLGCAAPGAKEVPPGKHEHEVTAKKTEAVIPSMATQKPTVIAQPVLEQNSLKEGVNLYNNGDYAGAIKKLSGATEIWTGTDKGMQLEALKYMAFSYCVTGQKTLCRQQFEKALKLDPGFDLAPGEKGHPLWEPAFVRAKKAK